LLAIFLDPFPLQTGARIGFDLRKVVVNAETVQVGTGTNLSEKPTYQDLSAFWFFDTIATMITKQLLCAIAFALLVAFTGAPVAVHAQHMNEKDSPCANVVVTRDLVNCLSKAKDAADAKLSAIYTQLRQRLGGEDADRLVETQRTWVKYRDENCTAERELYGGGTAAGPAYLACVEAMTRARTKELQITYTVRLKD
jgi:uncharacterized protein YecT (DUF1311 family)